MYVVFALGWVCAMRCFFFEVLCLSALARIQTWKGSIHYVNWYISWYHFITIWGTSVFVFFVFGWAYSTATVCWSRKSSSSRNLGKGLSRVVFDLVWYLVRTSFWPRSWPAFVWSFFWYVLLIAFACPVREKPTVIWPWFLRSRFHGVWHRNCRSQTSSNHVCDIGFSLMNCTQHIHRQRAFRL